MNPLNYRQPKATWQVLQRQYSQQPVVIPVPHITTQQVQPSIRPGTLFAGLGAAWALAVIFDRKSSKDLKQVAYQVLGVAAPAVLGSLFSIQ